MFLLHFDVFCDLLLNRRTATCVFLFWLILRSGFDVSFLTSISVWTFILIPRKVEFIKWINLINILFIVLVKFKIKRWFRAYQDQFFVWVNSLARLPTARVFFLSLFLKKEMALCFFFLLDFYLAFICLMPSQYFFVLIFCPIMSIIIQILKTLRHFKTQGEKTL